MRYDTIQSRFYRSKIDNWIFKKKLKKKFLHKKYASTSLSSFGMENKQTTANYRI